LKNGDVYDICDQYEASQLIKNDELISEEDNSTRIINNDKLVKIPKVKFYNRQDEETDTFSIGDFFKIRIFYHTQRKIERPIFSASLLDREGTVIFECYSDVHGNGLSEISGNGYVDLSIETLNIKVGFYDLTITLSEREHFDKLEWHDRAYKIVIIKNQYHINQGMIYPYPKWEYKI